MWSVQRADPFLKDLKKFRKHHQLLSELDEKINRLDEDPCIIGGELAGNLHGKRSTRLAGKYRLIFRIDEERKIVYLLALDHRKEVYD